MPSLIKELLHDYTRHTLDIDMQVSISFAIESLYKSKVISAKDLILLDRYYQGYSAEEIAMMFFLSTETVSAVLSRLLLAIEHASGYRDEIFLQSLAGKYNPRQIKQAQQYLEKHSREFNYDSR